MKVLLTWATVAFAFLAAVLWFMATKVRFEFNPLAKYEDGMFSAAITRMEGSRQIDILETADRQTRWNMWAAFVTGLSAACQAVSLLIPN